MRENDIAKLIARSVADLRAEGDEIDDTAPRMGLRARPVGPGAEEPAADGPALDPDELARRLRRPVAGHHHSPTTIAHVEAARQLGQLRDAGVADHEMSWALFAAVRRRLVETYDLPASFATTLAHRATAEVDPHLR
ncbi:unannotated protein [freshwater metagenome]|uniref:Unannotated protein n=1 Tax=freshwater metagenome TaxID=449393 RepID=A0A6J7KEN0_9ZZZZ|nr:hypothetical protein [Actinomycetota bacterium]